MKTAGQIFSLLSLTPNFSWVFKLAEDITTVLTVRSLLLWRTTFREAVSLRRN
jgi:hypothetical protein